jgi:hypothetical protein
MTLFGIDHLPDIVNHQPFMGNPKEKHSISGIQKGSDSWVIVLSCLHGLQ